jgi:hypothetical protein
MLQINVSVSSKVRQTAVSQGAILQSSTVHWKVCNGLSGFPKDSLLFVSDWEISKTDSMLLMTFIARAGGQNSGASVIFPVSGKEKEKRKTTHTPPHMSLVTPRLCTNLLFR